jgi:hypothetical protein
MRNHKAEGDAMAVNAAALLEEIGNHGKLGV